MDERMSQTLKEALEKASKIGAAQGRVEMGRFLVKDALETRFSVAPLDVLLWLWHIADTEVLRRMVGTAWQAESPEDFIERSLTDASEDVVQAYGQAKSMANDIARLGDERLAMQDS